MILTKNICFTVQLFVVIIFLQSPLYPQVNFEIIYGGLNEEHGSVVELTSDGGYIVGGSTESFSGGSLDLFLIKLNTIGDIEWSKTYSTLGDERISNIKQASTGDYYIVAWLEGGFGFLDILVMKVDQNGEQIWSRNFGGVEADEPRGLSITENGGILVSGYVASFGFGAKDLQFIKFNADGDIEWAKTLGTVFEDHNFRNIVTTDGNYLFSGATDFTGYLNWNPTLIKTDTLGNIIWAKRFPGSVVDWGRGLIEYSNGGYLMVGETETFGIGQSDIYVIKTNSSGIVLWAKAFGGAGNDVGYAITEAGDETLAITGYSNSFGFGGYDMFLLLLEPNGDFRRMNVYGNINDEQAFEIKLTDDNGFIMTGRRYTNSFGASDIYIVKTNSLGKTDCSYLSVEPVVTDVPINSMDVNFGSSSIISVATPVLATNNWEPASLVFCRVIPVELGLFDYEVNYDKVTLIWETVTETNNQGFKVFKDDKEIGFIPGSGTTIEPHHYSYIDENVENGTHFYSLIQIDYDGTGEKVGEIEVNVNNKPVDYSISQNYPNPFNPTTTIKYEIPELSFVAIKIYDVLGNEMATLVSEEKQAGEYKIEFFAENLPSGIYLYTVQAGKFTDSKKMILLK